MELGGQLEALPDRLQNGPDQIARVHEDESHQQKVERVPHVLSEIDKEKE